MTNYFLVDSGDQRKLEQFGPHRIARPCSQALWTPSLSKKQWKSAEASLIRENRDIKWSGREKLPEEWSVEIDGISFRLQPTDFGHLGLFPEQREQWRWMREVIRNSPRKKPKVLNLFAYSGGSSLACALEGAEVCHVDASKGMVSWARQNAELNGLQDASMRWIVDDAMKFLQREIRRGKGYDAIILDPPSFGRGAKGEVFKIEESILELLDLCVELLSDQPLFFLYSCHTPGFTPIVLQRQLARALKKGPISCGEMLLQGGNGVEPVPSGAYARWCNVD